MPTIEELRATCADAARRGGEVLRERLSQRRTITFKGPVDIVTDADKAAEAAVLALLRERHPGVAVLAEESGQTGERAAGLRFIVDPLDGTTNYAKGVPVFACNVAAQDETGIAAGATYDPLRDELFLAGRGLGATLNGEPIHVSGCAELIRAVLATGFPYDLHQHPELPLAIFSRFMGQTFAVRRLGSAALDLAYVACGRFDGFWEWKLKAWDMAAGLVLIREAGGVVTDYLGGDAMIEQLEVCAGAPALQPRLLEVLEEFRPRLAAERGR